MNIVLIRIAVTKISTILVYMAIYRAPGTPAVAIDHSWRIPMIELKCLKAAGMLWLALVILAGMTAGSRRRRA